MIKFSEFNINERYSTSIETKIINGFKIPKTYFIDYVFDHIVYIICNEKHISEKNFKEYDNIINYTKEIFDINEEIINDINDFEIDDKRYEYCAEYIYNKYFNLPKNNDIEEITEKTKYNELKDKLKRIRKINDELKQKISKFLSINCRYKNGVFYNLNKPTGLKTKMKNVGFGADRNGFFIYTHRARSKSYIFPDNIPDKTIKFIESTG